MSTELAILSNTVLRMTSREIAELVESRHDNVKRAIERLVERGVIAQPPMEDVPYVDESGRSRTVSCYIFSGEKGKRDSIVVVAQLSPEFTARLVDRWQELEAQAARPKLPTTYLEALRALVASEEQRELAEKENKLLHTVIDNEFGYCSILRAAQHLGVHESVFSWRPLKAETLRMGLEVKRVPSPRYKHQNLYPITVFEKCYPGYDFQDLQPELVADLAAKQLQAQA